MKNEWFKVENIDDRTFAISEYKHYEEFHSYLLLGDEHALLIDTGLGVSSIKDVINKLTTLEVKVVATHVHWDHIGGHKEFDDFYVHKEDEEWFKNGIPIPLEFIRKHLVKDVTEFPCEFDISKYEVFTSDNYTLVEDGCVFDLGNRKVEVIHTPGHSPGHICLYEPDRKYLYTGDLIYKGTLYANYPSTDPKLFRESVHKIEDLEVNKILPSHHTLDISSDVITDVCNAFDFIMENGGLTQGRGLFEFKEFSILI